MVPACPAQSVPATTASIHRQACLRSAGRASSKAAVPLKREVAVHAAAMDVPDDDARHENAQAEPELYEDKHAILHDFCMQLPYSWLLIAAGGVLWFNDTPKSASVLMVIAGLLCYQCARTSLRQWKLGLKSTFSTWCCALLSAYQAWVWGIKFKMMTVVTATWGPLLLSGPFFLFLASSAMTIFNMYNILAGGNPPPKRK